MIIALIFLRCGNILFRGLSESGADRFIVNLHKEEAQNILVYKNMNNLQSYHIYYFT